MRRVPQFDCLTRVNLTEYNYSYMQKKKQKGMCPTQVPGTCRVFEHVLSFFLVNSNKF